MVKKNYMEVSDDHFENMMLKIVSNYALDWNMMNITRYATSFKFMKMWFYHVGCINIVKVV